MEQVWTPAFKEIIDHLAAKAEEYKDKALLSLTHGQPATPTTLGKELAVYVYRLNRQLRHIENQEYLGKINGATGTFGAHLAACPDVDWIAVSREFVTNRMGLTWNPLTTQIESHDWQAELYSTVSHANRIMHNLCVDVWMYISRGVFAQVPVKRHRLLHDAAQGQPDPLRERRGQLRTVLLAARHALRHAGGVPLAARPDRFDHPAQHRFRARLLLARPDQPHGRP